MWGDPVKAIWVVTGTCGQYSDRSEWVVRAFKTKEQAEKFVALLDDSGNTERLEMRAREERFSATREQFIRSMGWAGEYGMGSRGWASFSAKADALEVVKAERAALALARSKMLDPRDCYEKPDYCIEETPFGWPEAS